MTKTSQTNKDLANHLDQLITVVDNLMTAVSYLTVAGGTNPPPYAQPAIAASFVLTPKLAASNKLINFNTKNGLSLCKALIDSLKLLLT